MQLTGGDITMTDVARPGQLKLCVNSERLESAIDLAFIEKLMKYKDLTDNQLRIYLNSKVESPKDIVTINTLDMMVEDDLRMDINDKDKTSQIGSVIISKKLLLQRNGLAWVTEEIKKVAISDVLSAIRPESLQKRLNSNLELAYY